MNGNALTIGQNLARDPNAPNAPNAEAKDMPGSISADPTSEQRFALFSKLGGLPPPPPTPKPAMSHLAMALLMLKPEFQAKLQSSQVAMLQAPKGGKKGPEF